MAKQRRRSTVAWPLMISSGISLLMDPLRSGHGTDRAAGLPPFLQQLLEQPRLTNLSGRLNPGQRPLRRGQRGGGHANVVRRRSEDHVCLARLEHGPQVVPVVKSVQCIFGSTRSEERRVGKGG